MDKERSVLAKVTQYLDTEWPNQVSEDLRPYFHRKNELSVEQDCILWGARVIIPPKGREEMMKELHQEHLGSTKMKQFARSYIWWPGLDKDLEELASGCSVCLAHRVMPKKAPLHPWDWPEKPWVRVHADYAGPVLGTYFLIITDAHSKWIETLPTKDTSATATVNLVRSVFARFGLPMTCVTDNGPNFASQEFNLFLEKNGVRHITSAPYQPSTNGQAENTVKTLKSFLKHCEGSDWRTQLDKFLFKFRVTPHSTTGVSPAELMFGRKLRTVLDLTNPKKCLQKSMLSKQDKQKSNFDTKFPRNLKLTPESPVRIRNYSTMSKDRWIPAQVLEQTGPVSYKCELPGGGVVRRHVDQLMTRSSPKIQDSPAKNVSPQGEEPLAHSPKANERIEPVDGAEISLPRVPSTPVRRSTRVVKPPHRLDL